MALIMSDSDTFPYIVLLSNVGVVSGVLVIAILLKIKKEVKSFLHLKLLVPQGITLEMVKIVLLEKI